MRTLLRKIAGRVFLPRWIIFSSDVFIISMIFIFTYLLRYNLEAFSVEVPRMLLQLAVLLPLFAFAEFLFKPYEGILRHSSPRDALAVIKTQIFIAAGIVFFNLIARREWPVMVVPYSVAISQFFIAVVVLVGMRVVVAVMYHRLVKTGRPGVNMMIFGAGEMGIITKSVFEKDPALNYRVVGFIDDHPGLHHKKVEGVMVYPPGEECNRIVKEKSVREMVLCVHPGGITKERKSAIVDWCIARQIRVKEVPGTKEWLNGRFFTSQVRDVMIEDLLGREPIEIDCQEVIRGIHGKRVMVTGAAGSIGSELVRQLCAFYPGSITLVDKAESGLYDLMNEIRLTNREVNLKLFVGDVTNLRSMQQLFLTTTPELIFHASAFKHVPLMEEQPYEAIRNNVLGTKTIVDLAAEQGVEKFVMISTDKAVNPTSVMGATKRICEIYIQWLSHKPEVKTRFVTTRFGNVLGSSGSVIPLFRSQIRAGGPVTVTHRDINRYFMTIPEACRLVLEASSLGKGGEVFLFNMGEPVRIYDMAEKMIRLSGFLPHKDIAIVETGLRPGEKLYEELLANQETSSSIDHGKILIAFTPSIDLDQTTARIHDLLDHLQSENDEQLVARMREIVREYSPSHSRFEQPRPETPSQSSSSPSPVHPLF